MIGLTISGNPLGQGNHLGYLHIRDLAASFLIDVCVAGGASDHAYKCHIFLLTEVNPLEAGADGCNPV